MRMNTRWIPTGLILLGVVVALLGSACRHRVAEATSTPSQDLHRFTYGELHMGTLFRIVMFAPDEKTADTGAEAAFRRIIALEDIMTDYDPKSELMQLCHKPAGVPHPISAELYRILERSQKLARETDGAFDVTVGPMIQLWRKARKSHVLPAPEEVARASQAVGYKKLKLDPRTQTATLMATNMQLDLGGIAKGLAADEALKTLRSLGINRAMVAASGDIALGDPPPGKAGWAIGIASIDHPTQGLTEEVLLHNAGISTSGDTEQYVEIMGKRYSHIVNPKTGVGLTDRIGVTIIASNATDSDGTATAVSVLGAKKGLAYVDKRPDLATLIIEISDDTPKATPSKRFTKRLGQQKPKP